MMEHRIMEADKNKIAEIDEEIRAKTLLIDRTEDARDLKREIRELELLVLELRKLAGMGGFDKTDYQKDYMFGRRQKTPGYGYGKKKPAKKGR